jgi:small-conductance mechanosensitive channel
MSWRPATTPPPTDDLLGGIGDEVRVGVDRWSAGQIGLLDLGVAAGVVALAILASWLVRRVARRYGRQRGGVGRSAVEAIGQCVSIAILLFASALVLEILGFGLGPIVVLVLIVVFTALFLRPIITNLSGGLLLQVRGAFNLGDEVETHGVVGAVEEITSRSVIIHTPDGRRVHIENTEVLGSVLTNLTTLGKRRSSHRFNLRVSTAADLASIVREAAVVAGAVDGVIDEPPPDALLVGFDGAAIEIEVRFWHAPQLSDEVTVCDAVGWALLSFLDDLDTQIADPVIAITDGNAMRDERRSGFDQEDP